MELMMSLGNAKVNSIFVAAPAVVSFSCEPAANHLPEGLQIVN